MENNDKYTVEPSENNMIGGTLKVGTWYQLQNDGDFIKVIGSYCEWPKREPRYFKVSYEKD